MSDTPIEQDQQQLEIPVDQTPPAPEQTPPSSKPAESTPASTQEVQEALKALNDIRQRMDQGKTPTPGAPTQEQIREQIREQTGWTDEQIAFHQNSIVNVVAPLQEQISWMELERRHPDIKEFKEDMLKELSDGYAPAQRANPVVLEKVYFLAKGKRMDSTPTPPTPPTSRPAERPAARIAPTYPGFDQGLDRSGRAPGDKTLTAEQKEYARRLGVPEEAYVAASKTRNVQELKRA